MRKKEEIEEPKLSEIVAKCFSRCIEDGIFYIGIDQTGLYLFTKSQAPSVIDDQLRLLKDDLELEDSDIELCVVGEQLGDYPGCSIFDVEDYVLQKAASRAVIFTQAEIKDIEACWDDSYTVSSEKEEVEEEKDSLLRSDAIAQTRRELHLEQVSLMLLIVIGFGLLYFKVVWWAALIAFIITLILAARLSRAVKSAVCSLIIVISILGIVLSLGVGFYENLPLFQEAVNAVRNFNLSEKLRIKY